MAHIESRVPIQCGNLIAGQRASWIAATRQIRLDGTVVILDDAQAGVQPLPIDLTPYLTLTTLLAFLQRITVVDSFRRTWKRKELAFGRIRWTNPIAYLVDKYAFC